jgi:hypothetical protein
MKNTSNSNNVLNSYITKNNSLFISIIIIFTLFGVIMFLNPKVIIFMFDTFLGNLLLILCVIGVGVFDIKYAIGMTSIFIILYQAFHIAIASSSSKTREGFTFDFGGGWSDKLKADFVQFQKTTNPNVVFDMNIIPNQATSNEAQYLLKTGHWQWSPEVKKVYLDAIAHNTIISSDPNGSMDKAQTIYNETAIKEILSWNAKEGVFLLDGVVIGHTADMPADVNNIVRCGTNDSGDITMQKIEYTGYNSVSGGMKSNITPVSNSMLPKVVNGFKFLKGECNPCVALNDPRNYSCPFSINTGNGDNVSSIWDLLWKQTDGSYNSGSYNSGSSNSDKANTDSSPQTVNSYDVFLDKSKFPLLNELKDEVLLGSSFVNVNWKQLRDSVSIKTPDSGSDKKKDKSSSSSKDKSSSGSSGSNVPKFITNDSLYEDKNPYGTRPTNMY